MRQAWPLVDPAPLVWNWHIDAVCDHLQAVYRGEIKRLLINMPPGHAKSLLFSVLWPAWIWTQDPSWPSLFASYSAELSIRDSVRCRQVIESEWYTSNFCIPDGWVLSADQNVKHFFTTTAHGHRFATSVGGGGTGHRGKLVAIDDPLKSMDAFSKARREEAVRWLGQTMSSRLNDMKTDRMVMVMQRLHAEDPSGYVLAGGGWEHLCLPSEFEPEHRCITHRTVRVGTNGTSREELQEFWRDPRTLAGELLFPAKFPADVLAQAKSGAALGATGYAGQHQQRPTPAGGGMFKRSWWRFHKPDGRGGDASAMRPEGCWQGPARPLPEKWDEILVSVDANFKAKETADPVAIHVWGKHGADRYLLDRRHGPFGFTRTVEQLAQVCEAWPKARRKLVEDKANGSAIIEVLQREVVGVIAVEPEGGKEARAWAIQPQVEAGNCFLPDGAPWLDAFVEEFSCFPLGAHDDDVDALSQALIVLGQKEEISTMEKWRRARESGALDGLRR